MKIWNILLASLAAFAMNACQTEKFEDMSGTSGQRVVIFAETESAPRSKTTLGLNEQSRPQTLWEDGDKITVYSSGNNGTGTFNDVLYKFEAESLDAPSPSASFAYVGENWVDGEQYLAIYPHTDGSKRSANFAETRMAQVDVPANQTLVAGGYDRSAAVMLAYSDSKESMKFMNAVALVKFQVADENVTRGSFNANGVAVAGRFRGDVVLDENGKPCGTELVIYSSGSTNAPTSTLNFSLADDAPLVPGTDYYVAVRPTSIEDGFSVSLNGELVKTYDIRELKRNTIYNLGVLSLPEKEDTPEEPGDGLTLFFDFSTAPEGWPTAKTQSWASLKNCDSGCKTDNNGTADETNPRRRAQVTYYIDNVGYDFTFADPDGATAHNIYYGTSNGGVYSGTSRYFGLPMIDGKKLVKIEMVQNASTKTEATFQRLVGVTANIYSTEDEVDDIEYVAGGEPQNQRTNGGTYTYSLTGTLVNTVYYLNSPTNASVIKSLKLVYQDAGEESESVRVGTYNVRYINDSETDENNLWENRKDRVISSVKDNDFDILGVQECSAGIKEYLESQLASTYAGEYFNPYSATGIGDSDKVEYIGILYKKDEFTLSQGHKFWLATTLEGSESRPSERNDASGEYTYYRGGYCCVLTHNSTGEKFFVMTSHGCLGADKRAEYAAIYEAVEKAYNPNGYPAFFVGDLNARPSDQASVKYRSYWSDPYRELPTDKLIGPFATYNGFNLKLNLDTDGRRLDYIYYRNATPVKYVCNEKMYDGYYASDHLPVYVDFVITK